MTSDPYSATFDPTRFRLPAVRHLAWMCQAPQLTDSPLAFDLQARLPVGTLEKLQGWEKMQHTAPPALLVPAHPRLGFYFERLYQCLLEDILGWEVLVCNLPIRTRKRTLGELDFIVRDPATGEVEHHEIAIKFYLGHGEAPVRWYGPNAVDRLDLKTTRMLEQQSQRIHMAESVAALAALGIDMPQRSRIFMPGYLFYPPWPDIAPPAGVPADHLRGRWVYLDAARGMDTTGWVHLRKPHWLGPWIQSEEPTQADAVAVLDQIALSETPRLFARMRYDARANVWKESEKIFVVPARWPG